MHAVGSPNRMYAPHIKRQCTRLPLLPVVFIHGVQYTNLLSVTPTASKKFTDFIASVTLLSSYSGARAIPCPCLHGVPTVRTQPSPNVPLSPIVR